VSKRKKRRGWRVAALVAVISLALAAALLWHWLRPAPAPPDAVRTAAPLRAPTLSAPGGEPRPADEEFNTVERQGLENILRQKNAAGQR